MTKCVKLVDLYVYQYILGSYEGYVIIILDRINLLNYSLLKVHLKLVLVHIKLVLVDESSFGTK